MDTKTAEQRISQLARSMKELHLVATIEEGYQRAKEILEGTPQQTEEKTVNEVFGIKNDEEITETPAEEIQESSTPTEPTPNPETLKTEEKVTTDNPQ